MTYATMLAVIDGREGSEAVAKASLTLGGHFSAAVTWLHVISDPQVAFTAIADGMGGMVTEQLLERLEVVEDERLAKASDLFRRLCRDPGLNLAEPGASPEPGRFSVAFVVEKGSEAQQVEGQGRLADLVIAARPGPDGEAASSQLLQAAILDTGRPVLTLPASGEIDPAASMAIAWDCSRESAKAVTAALPLLKGAKKIVVITARSGDAPCQPSRLLGYLSAHGITAETWAFTPEKGGLGEAILAQCATAGSELLVMGAYGHSPIREMVLGGATRDILKRATIPVLVAH